MTKPINEALERLGIAPVLSNMKPHVDNYFGGCPHCGETHGFLNVGPQHFHVCDTHRTYWLIGENLFSGWKDETEEEWDRNAEKLGSYRKVEPLPCSDFDQVSEN
jgi:hypothetical protein